MTQITEDYVSYDIAKLLKEKGFDVYVRSFYEKDKYKTKEEFSTNNALWNYNISSFRYSAPTLQMAMKWLREVHNVFIDISSRFSKNADKDICFSYSCKKLIDTYKSSYEIGDGEWLNYEEASEAAIKYCLENLI